MSDRRLRWMDEEAVAFVEQMTQALRDAPDCESGIDQLLEQTKTRLCAEAISTFMVDEPRHELVLRYAASPDKEKVIGLRMPWGQGVVGWVVQHNESLIVPSTSLDSRFYSGVDKKTGFVTRSILCVPMVHGDRVRGAMEALNKTAGHFNDDDVLLLQEIAGAMAGRLLGA